MKVVKQTVIYHILPKCFPDIYVTKVNGCYTYPVNCEFPDIKAKVNHHFG
jgi:hypothetical protein